MEQIALKQITCNNAQKIKAQPKPAPCNTSCNEDDKNKALQKALLGLAIVGSLGITAAAIIHGKNKNKTSSIGDSSKKIKASADELGKIAKKDKLEYNVTSLGNGRIKVNCKQGDKMLTPFEMPEYLYHITSSSVMDEINKSGVLKISQNEQLQGLYLLDSENFLSKYAKTNVPDKNKDLLSAIFNQANKNNKKLNIPRDQQQLTIIQIPTKDLLENGKLRIRTQEDFFRFKDEIEKLTKNSPESFSPRNLCQDDKRAKFRDYIISNNLMSEKDADDFIKEMTDKLHRGYHPANANLKGLENTNCVEYIFNKDIELSQYPNIKTKTIFIKDFISSGKIDSDKAKTIFETKF